MTVAQTAEVSEIELTAGDAYTQIAHFNYVDYSAYDMVAQVRVNQDINSTLLATFAISTSYENAVTALPEEDQHPARTVVVMSLTENDTRNIGNNGEGYWDIQIPFASGTRTPIGGHFAIRQDVTNQ